ncbi:ATP-binding protein [Trichothermofontia sichuanensis B231]|uniref:ATP-binding protein n=1 Tax=Trichothermofontia sichuanensis TaxID=3045816 RepID=UPI002248510E|nr:ATP-binding protein [Trichothermofontia sichuanensis]UZQ52880.1 ATP-binding protein [Trichothermofontia sichuanensis B231]
MTIAMEPLLVPGVLDSLSAIASYVMAAAKAAGLEKKPTYNLRLAVDEIATNIIVYGYQGGDAERTIVVQTEMDDQALTVTLEDTAPKFDPTQQELPDADDFNQPLAERPIGGLGVYLAVQGVDQFQYQRLGDKNRNIFVVYKSPPAA